MFGRLARITFRHSPTTPSFTLCRDLSTQAIAWKGTCTLSKEAHQECITKAVEFFAFVGLDALGINNVSIASGGFHPQPNDPMDTFNRMTVACFKDDKEVSLKGNDGRFYKRIHIPRDKSLWTNYKGYFSLA